MYRINYVAIFIIISFSTSIVFAYSPPLTPPKILNKDKPTYNKKPVGYNGTESQTSMMYYNKGTTATLSGDFDEAIDNYRLALEADSMFIEAYDNLGRAFRGKGEIDSAIYYYKKSLSLYPKGIFANQNLGVAYMADNDYDMAEKTYRHITEILPESPEGYYGLAQVYFITAKFEKALVEADIAIQKYEGDDSDVIRDGYLMKAFIYGGMEDNENLKKYLKLAKEHGAELTPEMEAIITDGEIEESESDTIDYETLIKAIDWYIETPISEKTEEKRKAIGEALFVWVVQSPDVQVMLVDSNIVDEDCPKCLIVFMIAWSKYSLENDAKDKPIDCCYYATRVTTGFYSKNKDQLGEITKYEELIELELDGRLKDKIKEDYKLLDEMKR